jgi:hypothetical protein
MSTTVIPPEMLKGTPMERFERILKRIVSVPKSKIDPRISVPLHRKKGKRNP